MTNLSANWKIEFDTPEVINRGVYSANDMSHALEKLFSYPNEGFVIVWNNTQISIPYCYGLSDILEDVLDMIEALLDEDNEEYVLGFTTNEILDADWFLSWKGDLLEIEAEWRIAPVCVEVLNKNCSNLKTSKRWFCCEWRNILLFLLKSVYDLKMDYNDELYRILYIVNSRRF